MKTYARMQNGTVAEFLTTAADIDTLFNHQITWIDVSGVAHVEIGWAWQPETGFAPPPAEIPSAADVTPLKIADLHAQLLTIQAQLNALSAPTENLAAQ